jgi:hypothetical protein
MGVFLESLYNARVGQTGVQLKIWSAGADIETLRLHAEFYRQYYDGMGYKVAPGRKALQYRVRAVPGPEFKYVDVELVAASRRSSKVVGRFKTSREAQAFIETYYGADNSIKFPVYAVNSATKELVLERQTKVLEIR